MSNAIKLLGIEWDCDNPGEAQDLPSEVVIREMDLPDYIWDDLEEAVGDYLAEKFGYCNKGYGWEFTCVEDGLEGGRK